MAELNRPFPHALVSRWRRLSKWSFACRSHGAKNRQDNVQKENRCGYCGGLMATTIDPNRLWLTCNFWSCLPCDFSQNLDRHNPEQTDLRRLQVQFLCSAPIRIDQHAQILREIVKVA